MLIRATITSNFMSFKAGDAILLEVPEVKTPATVCGRLLVHAQVQNAIYGSANQHEIDRKTVVTSKVIYIAFDKRERFLAIQFEGNQEPSILTAKVHSMDCRAAKKLRKKLTEKKVRYVPPKALRKPLAPIRART